MKSVPIAANMVLSRGIFAVGQQLEEDGWHVIEDGGNFITFDKDIYEEQKERQK